MMFRGKWRFHIVSQVEYFTFDCHVDILFFNLHLTFLLFLGLIYTSHLTLLESIGMNVPCPHPKWKV